MWNARRGPSSPSISYLGWRSCRLQVAACVVKTIDHRDSDMSIAIDIFKFKKNGLDLNYQDIPGTA